MVPGDALRKNLKDMIGSNLLNIAPQKEKLTGDASLGKRDASKEKGFADSETGFICIPSFT
jgi:hypothetical protein